MLVAAVDKIPNERPATAAKVSYTGYFFSLKELRNFQTPVVGVVKSGKSKRVERFFHFLCNSLFVFLEFRFFVNFNL